VFGWLSCNNVQKDTPTTIEHIDVTVESLTDIQTAYLDSVVLPNVVHLPNDVPKSVIVAQAILESGNGTSTVVKTKNNHFGHRTSKGYVAYKNDYQCFQRHYRLLKSRYNTNGNYRQWCNTLDRKGYAEFKGYGQRIQMLIQKLKLERLDGV
jgi:flagellum-specific peptidoglycan hydrolase FlgJ